MKKFCLVMGLVMLAVLARPEQAGAQSAVRVIVSVAAPVFVKPDNKITPLRVAKEGSILILEADEGDWDRVVFDDPQFGRRVGYIEKRHVRVQIADPQQAVDLTAPDSRVRAQATAETKTSQNSRPQVSSATSAIPSAEAAAHTLPPAAATAVAATHRTIFVTKVADDFHVYLSAALSKKSVPLTIVTKEEGADYVLTSSVVQIQQQSAGSKFARCMFAYCGGIEDSGTTSVQLTHGDEIVWSYSVNKGRGEKNRQSLAEAVAVHLKDFLTKR